MQRFLLVFFALFILTTPTPVSADGAENAETWSFHGFAFGGLTDQEGGDTHSELGHLWLLGSKEIIKDRFSLLVILSPEGPPKLVHSFWFDWKPQASWVDAVRFGRHIPNFGYEYWFYRIDHAPTIGYTALVKRLVARANGIEVETHLGKTQVVGSAFTEIRVGGNIPEHNSGWDYYLRLRRPLVGNLFGGVSYRLASKDAVGVDLVWQRGDTSLAGEFIQSESQSEWYVLWERQLVKRLRATACAEHLRDGGRRLVFGPTVGINKHLELKVNGVLSDGEPNELLGQLTVRW